MEEKVKQYDILSNKLDENNIYNELIYILDIEDII